MHLLKTLAVALLTASLVLWGIPAQAVVKNVILTDVGGKPVANAVVTVYNGKDEEIAQRTTDNKGLLVYDFPEGKNVVRWKGGSQEVLVAETKPQDSSILSGSTGLIVAGALGVGLIVALAGGGGGGDSTPAPTTTPTETTPTTEPTPTSTVPKAADLAGTYALSGTKTADTCNSAPASISNSAVGITVSGTQLTVKNTATMSGDYSENSGTAEASGTTSDGLKETIKGTFVTKDSKITFSGTRTTLDSTSRACATAYDVTMTKN